MDCRRSDLFAPGLCKRLMVVNEQISFECIYGAASIPEKRPESSIITLERMTSQPGSTIKPAALRGFPSLLTSAIASFDSCWAHAALGPAPGICGGERRWTSLVI